MNDIWFFRNGFSTWSNSFASPYLFDFPRFVALNMRRGFFSPVWFPAINSNQSIIVIHLTAIEHYVKHLFWSSRNAIHSDFQSNSRLRRRRRRRRRHSLSIEVFCPKTFSSSFQILKKQLWDLSGGGGGDGGEVHIPCRDSRFRVFARSKAWRGLSPNDCDDEDGDDDDGDDDIDDDESMGKWAENYFPCFRCCIYWYFLADCWLGTTWIGWILTSKLSFCNETSELTIMKTCKSGFQIGKAAHTQSKTQSKAPPQNQLLSAETKNG